MFAMPMQNLNAHKKEHMTTFECRFCDKRFENMSDLMKHNKKDHEQRVSACRNFDGGYCEYEEKDCWFIHNANLEVKSKCTMCVKTFNSRCNFLKHRKMIHPQIVPFCRNKENDLRENKKQ